MLWWTLRMLKSAAPERRRRAIERLAAIVPKDPDLVQRELERQLCRFPQDEDLIGAWKRVRKARGYPMSADRPDDERRRIFADFQNACDSEFLTWDLAGRVKQAATLGDLGAISAMLERQGARSHADAGSEVAARYKLQSWELSLILKEGETKSWSRETPGDAAGEPGGYDAPMRDSLRCAYCGTRNRAANWPRFGDSVAFYFQSAERTEQEPGAHRLAVDCPQCDKRWFVVWDADPR